MYPLTSPSNNNLTNHYSVTLTYHTTDLKAKSKPGQQLLHILFISSCPFSPFFHQFLTITKSKTSQTKIHAPIPTQQHPFHNKLLTHIYSTYNNLNLQRVQMYKHLITSPSHQNFSSRTNTTKRKTCLVSYKCPHMQQLLHQETANPACKQTSKQEQYSLQLVKHPQFFSFLLLPILKPKQDINHFNIINEEPS